MMYHKYIRDHDATLFQYPILRNSLFLGLIGGLLLLLLLGDSSLSLSCLSLLNQCLGLDGISLLLVNGLNKDSLVLKHVTLSPNVEVSVDVAVDLALLSILAEESSENSLPSDPEDLAGHTSLLGTSTLTGTHVSTLALSEEIQADSGARVHSHRLLDDQTILDECSDSSPGAGLGNLRGLIRIQPHSVLSTLRD